MYRCHFGADEICKPLSASPVLKMVPHFQLVAISEEVCISAIDARSAST